jgi:two-component system, OmpR family, sensor histidine kinase VicK
MSTTQSSLYTLQEMGRLSKDGMVIYDLAKQRIVYINEPAASLTGLCEQAGPAEIDTALYKVHPDDRELLRTHYAELILKPDAEVEFALIAGKKEMITCCQTYRISDSALLVILRDTTLRKQHEEYLVKYGAKKNTLLDNLTHHLSGALNLMRHLSSEAEKHVSGTGQENIRTYLSLMQANSQHCLDVINDLLRNEHRESEELTVNKTRGDVVQIVNFIYQELQQVYTDRKIRLYSMSPSMHILTDEIKLLQVINNLLSNALKFSRPDEVISIGIHENAEEVIVSVKDQGIGIPETLKPQIFQKQPLGTGRIGLNGERSTGLGLSICKTLTELMGGRIWFESEEGKGSTFYVAFLKA